MALERIVRPFQTGDVFNARVLLPPVPPSGFTVSEDVCLLTWKGENGATFDSDQPDPIESFKADWKEDKASRVTQNVRVENPDDSSQYVEVQRLLSTTFKNEDTGKKMNLKFAPWS